MRRWLTATMLIGALTLVPISDAVADRKGDRGDRGNSESHRNDGDHRNDGGGGGGGGGDEGGGGGGGGGNDRFNGPSEDNDNDGVRNNVPDDGDNRHPSGRDRSVEPGGSGDQGRSMSDPDGNSNGGMDKPGGSGGIDKHDQDYNNGCGNDDDFEDDNNGNCGGLKKGHDKEDEPDAIGGGEVNEPTEEEQPEVGVGSRFDNPRVRPTVGVRSRLSEPRDVGVLSAVGSAVSPVASAVGTAAEKVAAAAAKVEKSPVGTLRNGVLPFTGGPLGLLALIGLNLIGAGGAMAYATRRRTGIDVPDAAENATPEDYTARDFARLIAASWNAPSARDDVSV